MIKKKKLFVLGVALISFLPLWFMYLLPQLTPQYEDLLPFEAQIFSVDNFYDESSGEYSGEQTSKTLFTYEVVGTDGDILLVENTFDVRTLDNEPIVLIQRLYGIDKSTGAHMTGFGDKDRNGYLFAPTQIEKGESFTYWHINYDAPAEMMYVEEELLHGLRTYHYTTAYEESTIDQSNVLSHLPNVPETRGVVLDPKLHVWVEPVTGSLITYKDNTVAYYYDKTSREKIAPWNHFSNSFKEQSVLTNVQNVQRILFTKMLQRSLFPILIGLIGLLALIFSFSEKRLINERGIYVSYLLSVIVIAGSIAVMCGWYFDIDILKRFVPGLVTMKFSTALAFFFSGLVLFFTTRIVRGRIDYASVVLPGATLIIYLFMGLSLTSSLLGFESGIENLFVTESKGAIFTSLPGRPSIGTMIAFIFVASIGVVSMIKLKRSKVNIVLATMTAMISAVAILGYVLNVPEMYFAISSISSGMALHTSLFFIFLSIGVICNESIHK